MHRDLLWERMQVTYKDPGMKQYKYLYQKMLDENVIRRAYRKLRKGKTKRKEIKEIDTNLDYWVEKMRVMIENTKPSGEKVEHPELAFKPVHHKPKMILEHGKLRKIYMPTIIEQWLHHVIIQILAPIVLATASPNVCGSFPRRGPHYGKRKIVRWIKSGKNVRWLAKMDIRHFYDSIRYGVLVNELRKRIKDEWFLYIIMLCLSEFKKGLPLGYYISQWLANYILEPVDRLIRSISAQYIRYMDDIVIFSNRKKTLKDAVNKISTMLGRRFILNLKSNYQVMWFHDEKNRGHRLNFMGFIFYRNRTIIRKSIMLNITRLAQKIFRLVRKGYNIYRKYASAMLSYLGWFKHTDSYNCFVNRIEPYVSVAMLKGIISRKDRRDRHDRMERNKILGETRLAA